MLEKQLVITITVVDVNQVHANKLFEFGSQPKVMTSFFNILEVVIIFRVQLLKLVQIHNVCESGLELHLVRMLIHHFTE